MKKSFLFAFSIMFAFALNAQNTIAEPEAIDLGLSVKWASFNLGASKPEEYGNYYAWGEIQPKQDYDWKNYQYGSNSVELTKYVTQSRYGKDGFTDRKTLLDSLDDAASTLLGGLWRIPTDNELSELRKKCSWTWTTENGINGYRIKGPSNKTIFLPAAGMYINANNDILNEGGRYWSSNVFDNNDLASILYFDSNSSHTDWDAKSRPYGLTIRPVLSETSNDPAGINNITPNSNIGIQTHNGTVTLSGLDNNEKVFFYSIDGKEIASGFPKDETFTRTFKSNRVIIVKHKDMTTKIAL